MTASNLNGKRPNGQSNQASGQKTLVYLVRHGQTEWNKTRRFQGQLDIPLSELGREQAAALARWLKEQPVHFSAIYSSDLKRAAQTARIIGKIVGIWPAYSQALREINVGDWQGLSVDEVETRYPGKLQEWDSAVDRFTLPNGESIPAVQQRVFGFFRSAITGHEGKAIIIVAHGVALVALTAAIFGWDLVETWQTNRARLGNTGVSVVALDMAGGSPTMLLANSVGHLDALVESNRQ